MKENNQAQYRGKHIAITLSVLLAAAFMLYLRFNHVTLISLSFSGRFGHEISYQLLTFILLILIIGISLLLGGKKSLSYLHPGRFDGPVEPVPLLGINRKGNESWKQVGSSMLIIITLVTALVIYFQVFRGNEASFSMIRVLLPALGFSLINSLIEEGIFRFSIVSVFLSTGASAKTAAILSGLIFGGVHYFGSPGGIPGVFLAGFLGWLLAKSIAETRSIGWAWLIHCVQDIIIFSALFASDYMPV